MRAPLDPATPRDAVCAMIDAGAVFTVRRRGDSLGISFSYRVTDGGDIEQCRRILTLVKEKPSAFFQAFRTAVLDIAHVDAIEGDVSTSPTSAQAPRNEGAA